MAARAGSEKSETARIASLAARVLAALGGGYLLTVGATLALAAALPTLLGTAPDEAGRIARLLSFTVFAGAAVWCFAAASARAAWAGLLLAGFLLALPAGLAMLVSALELGGR